MEEQTDLFRSARFRKEREDDWIRLEALVSKAESHGLRRMSFGEARDLAALYREATTSLAIAREISLDKGLLLYLEALAARAYLSVYAPQESVRGVIARFLRKSGPEAIRRSWFFVLLGFLCLGLGGVAGYLLYLDDPAWFYVVMPPELAGGRGPNATTESLRSVIFQDDPNASGLGAFATFLFSNNTRIAIFAFGLGVFLCAPAIMLTFYNGLAIGAFVGLHVERGLGWDLFGWLSIHGVTELSAIGIASGGGLQLGAAILFPGQHTRGEALRIAGRDAAKLAIIAGLMLIAAAILEGYGRQLVQDTNMRLIIGWGVGALWLWWFTQTGRERP